MDCLLHSHISHTESLLNNNPLVNSHFHQINGLLGAIHTDYCNPVLCPCITDCTSHAYSRIFIHSCDHFQIWIFLHQFIGQLIGFFKKGVTVNHLYNIFCIIPQALSEALFSFHCSRNPFYMTDYGKPGILIQQGSGIFPQTSACLHIICGNSKILKLFLCIRVNIGNADSLFLCLFQQFI